MLFDLRGRGRRRTVQIIYLGLALLMGGGLVLFGIGSNTSGGLFDALSGNQDTSATSGIDKRINNELKVTRANPKDAKAWAALALLRYQRAAIDGIASDGTYTAKGKAKLQLASQAWEKHLSLDPKPPDASVAKIMVQMYQPSALNDLHKAVQAFEIVAAAEQPPSTNIYQQLAQLAYTAGDTRSGDLAANRAVDLAPAAQRKLIRQALDAAKVKGQTQQTQPQTAPSG